MKKSFALFFTLFIAAFLMLSAGAEALPGINVLTGNENPLTFDESTALPDFVSNAVICASPFENESGNAIMHYIADSGEYAAVGFSVSPALDRSRAYQISFKIYQYADEGFGKYKNLWIMKNGMSGWQRVQNCGGFNANSAGGWLEYSYLVDTFDDLVHSTTGKPDETDISKILLEWRYDSESSACNNQKVYIDDVSVVPAYFVTYIDEDGKTIRSGYENLVGEKYTPSVCLEDEERGILGWSKENDGTVDKTISLENKDFTLYAVYDNTLYFNLDAQKNMLSSCGDSTIITSDLSHRKGTDGITVSFSCSDSFVELSDNGDGTVKVTSQSEGLAKIVCTSSTGETDEIYILSDYTQGKEVMKIVESVSEIKTDAQSVTAKAVLFTAIEKDTKIRWKSSSDCVAVSSNGNGIATLTPVSNGSAVITAYIEEDEDVCDSFTVTVSGQIEKEKVYELNVLVWGASLAKHPPADNLFWYGNWGMAASKEENDFAHRLVHYLEEKYYPSKVNLHILAESGFDTSINNDTSSDTDYRDNQYYLNLKNAIDEFNPNIIVTIRTGNLSNDVPVDIAYNAYSQVYDMVYSQVPDAIVVAHHCLLHHDIMKEELYARLDERYTGKIFEVNDLDVHEKEENLAREWLELGQGAVANHWNDKGHDQVAKITMEYLNKHIPEVLTPSFIYRPAAITISGKNTITEKKGAVQLYVKASPDDASDRVVWSSSNENLASVNANGLVTAKNNGKVTIKATSTFDENVHAEYEITITNQPPVYTITYDKNTGSDVSGMPAAFDYAGDGYILSDAVPERACYNFLGWGTTPDAAETVTVLDIVQNTTVYAIWEKIEGFEFEGTYTEDKLFSYGFDIEGGFHVEVKDSCLFTVCTAGEKVTFKSPEVDIKNKNTISFSLSCGYFDSTSTIELTVRSSGDEEKFIFPVVKGDSVTYIADISSLSGNISGFDIYVNSAPEDKSMFNIALDFVRFEHIGKMDAENDDFIFTDKKAALTNMEISSFSEVEFSEEAVLFTLEDGYSLEVSGQGKMYFGSDEEGARILVNKLGYDEENKYGSSETLVYVNTADGFVEEAELSQKLTTYDNPSIRTSSPQGIRVTASVISGFYENSDVEEYGFVVGKKSSLENGKIRDVVLDEDYINSKLVVYGKAYSKTENIHKVFESNDEKEIFAGVLINIPKTKSALSTTLIFKAYIKLSDGSIIYGSGVETSALDIADALYYSEDTDEATKAVAKQILIICDAERDVISIPLDELWN